MNETRVARSTTKPEMSTFRSVLVPIDFGRIGDRALATVAALAARAPLDIHLATVSAVGLDVTRDQMDLVSRARRLGVTEVHTHIIETGADIPADLEPAADVASGLHVLLEALPTPLLCIASHGRTAIGEMLLGSVTDDLLRTYTGPTLVVGPDADPGRVPPTLAVCVGPDGTSQQLTSAASAWQRTFGGCIELVEVIEPTATRLEPPSTLVDAAHHLRGQMITVASHDPAQALIDVAFDRDVMLAVAAHLRRGVARVVLGSVAWEVIQRSPTAVLVVPMPRSGGSIE